jgi:sodium-dependent dicarboxylate transporter 2/3/5
MHFLRRLMERRWLFLGLLIGTLLLLLPPPDGLSPAGMRALAILVVAVIYFITEPIPLPAVALLIAVLQALLQLSAPNQVAESFMSDSVFFIMGALMISVAIVKQRLDRRIAFGILRLTGPRVGRLAFGITAVSAVLASFIGEHTVAAMMLPVVLAIVALVREDHPEVRGLAAVLIFSVAYGAQIAGVGTPSGGARNAIMLDYWRSLFGIHVGYLDWMKYAYPMILLQIPILPWLLLRTFRPEVTDVRRALVRLRQQVRQSGRLSTAEWQTIAIFLLVLLSWVTLSGRYGLGIVALLGASLYLILGLVKWDDLNSGVNWGVVWLYAAAISLGLQLQQTGAAAWLAQTFLSGLALLGITQGLPLLLAMIFFMLLLTNTMSTGAAVAVLGPITLHMAQLTGGSLLSAGFVTAIASAFGYVVIASTPAGMIAYSSGLLRPSDYLRAGAKLALVSVIILLVLAGVYWPLIGLPR